ncbi:MAG: FAD-dependent oxidoreductase [bacterium]|nr:FAD-dependent oxidoreductase [bacterium]
MKKYSCIIIGCGPAGIFAALELTKNKPDIKIAMFEKGKIIGKRQCPKSKTHACVSCHPCNISCGWGGAGAFSDGKLSLSKDVGGWLEDYIGSTKTNELIKYVDDIYLKYGANTQVAYNSKYADEFDYKCSKYGMKLIKCPVRHLGTEKSSEIMQKMYEDLSKKDNVDIFSNTTVDKINLEKKEITIKDTTYTADNIVLAVGRSGAEWLTKQCLNNNIIPVNNQVDIGLRVELPRSIMDEITNELYEIKIYNTSKTSENIVRTFCMNPGGFVSQENYDDDLAVVNGHSYQNIKTNNTNFALLVSAQFTSPFNEPIEYGIYIAKLCNMLTGGKIMVQRLKDLKHGKRSTYNSLKKLCYEPTLKDAVPGDLSFALPSRILNAILETFDNLENVIPGIGGDNTILYGAEVKFYSSKIPVDKNMQTSFSGVYAIGDGAGITRGLMQASASGIVAAKSILKL